MEHVVEKSTFSGTWLDKKGETETFYLTKPAYDELNYMYDGTGLRVYVMKWIEDDNKTEISLQEGDGRTYGFKKYLSTELMNPTKQELDEVINQFIDYAVQNNLI